MPIKPREIWEKATPLNEAWLVFSDSKLRGQFEAAKNSDPQKHDPNLKGLELALFTLGAMAKIAASPQRQKQLAGEMQTQLTDKLRGNQLIAVAYPLRPSLARIPRFIGCEFWTGAEINWEGQTAQDQSAAFHRIRIFNPAHFPALELNRPTGRKTHKQIIDWAIAENLKLNPDFNNQVHKAKCDQIRNFIKSNYGGVEPFGRGWGDDAIRKHVTSYFRNRAIHD